LVLIYRKANEIQDDNLYQLNTLAGLPQDNITEALKNSSQF